MAPGTRFLAHTSLAGPAAFIGLTVSQALHSFEEYYFRLWEVFIPAQMVVESIDGDPRTTFGILNTGIVVAMALCAWLFHRRGGLVAAIAWFWVALQLINGTTHVVVAIAAGGYVPGVVTAPLLLAFAVTTAYCLLREPGQPVTPEG